VVGLAVIVKACVDFSGALFNSRRVYGTLHKISIKHLGRYCDEFSYRFYRRGNQSEMFGGTVKGLLNGNPLPLKKLTASETSDT
jgi:hypothetical protein